jgi:hypothetical protein
VPGSRNPPFAWLPALDNGTRHLGLPPRYDFGFVDTTAAAL